MTEHLSVIAVVLAVAGVLGIGFAFSFWCFCRAGVRADAEEADAGRWSTISPTVAKWSGPADDNREKSPDVDQPSTPV